MTFIGTNTDYGVDVDIVELKSIVDIVDKYCKDKKEKVEILRRSIPLSVDKYTWEHGRCKNVKYINDSPIEDLFNLEEVETVRLSNDDNKIYMELCDEQKKCLNKSQEIVFTFNNID